MLLRLLVASKVSLWYFISLWTFEGLPEAGLYQNDGATALREVAGGSLPACHTLRYFMDWLIAI